jgi:uncharacterized LabA/DUF88 family protein
MSVLPWHRRHASVPFAANCVANYATLLHIYPITNLRRAVGSKAAEEKSKAAFAFLWYSSHMRTIVYIDGFNLYYRQLKQRPEYRWLNILKLAEEVLSKENDIAAVNYYTARVSARVKPDGPRNQQIYLDALSTLPEVAVHFGNFQVNKGYAPIVPLTSGRPVFLPAPQQQHLEPWPDVVRIIKTEEKGSDVNLASHLVRDAFQDRFDVAAVLTNDTDLIEPIRIVREELNRPVGIISPVDRPAAGLAAVASFVRHIRTGHLASAQFPNPLERPHEAALSKPLTWVAKAAD